MLLLALLACGTPSPPLCGSDTDVLVDSQVPLTCAEAKIPTRYIRVLAGKPLPAGSTATGVAAVRERYLADPAATRTWLDAIREAGQSIETAPGLRGAELRSAEVYRATGDAGPIRRDMKDLWNILDKAVSVYARDDEEKLALTEVDIEAWITYASLCHEVQGSGVLTVSIAQRVDIYTMAKSRFEQGDRAEMVALTAFGPIWEDVRNRWQAASYEEQQAWIATAPRPPRIDASSLAYIEAVIEGDLARHAEALHTQLGPFYFRDGPGYFTGAQ